MKKIIKRTLIVLLIFLLYVIIGMLAPFVHMKSVSPQHKAKIHTEEFYSKTAENGSDRAKIVEDNKEALDLRLDMMRKAKKEIIFSTFDIREGNSTEDIFAVITDAARRGVKVRILVDGLYGTLHMSGKDMFHAVGSEPNVEIRFYNTPNLLKPWTVNGCLHDKYIVVDNQYLLMGGRNTFDYFLGKYPGKSVGLDREILIVNKGEEKDSAVGQVKTYFEKVWKLDVCKVKFDGWSDKRRAGEIKRLLAHEKKLKVPSVNYEHITVPTRKTTLVTNPTHIYGKEPIVWETLKELMLDADQRVLVHTPYAVFSEEMYDGMKEIKKKVSDTKMILNSIASGDNICASADYKRNRKNILDTGVSMFEYMGKYSTHGKSLVIDDDIAIVGSYNFDCRSTYVDTETMLVVQGREITAQLEEKLTDLKDGALEVKADGTYKSHSKVKERTISSGKKWKIDFLSFVIPAFRYLV